ncbi:MAG TPA: SDR family NAD(P)-dependent oxidoreductase, partial [Phytomonospora sp.]
VVVAVRDGRVLDPAITPLPATTAPSVFAVLDGTVVVTGGTGGMGLALAAHLTAASPDVRVALLNRRHDDRDASIDLPPETAAALDALGEARRRVGLWRADVTDGPDLEARLDEIRAAHGPVTGVVHAAGLPGDGFAITKTWEEFARVLAPKTAGVRLLDRATRADPLRFFALCSSMTAVLGAPGQSDYAAANAYLDAYAARMRAEGRPALAVGWTGWSDSGMARRHGVTGAGQLTAFVGDGEGCALLDEALTAAPAQVLAGAFVPEEVRRRRTEIGAVIDLPAVAEAPSNTARPSTEAVDFDALNVRGLPARRLTPVQRAVAVAWCSTLDTRELDVHDLFFESGGNSLLASRLQLELDRRFPGVVNIADIFAYPTVVQLSDHIAARTAPPEPPGPVNARRPAPTASSLSDLLDDFLAGKVSIQEVVDS